MNDPRKNIPPTTQVRTLHEASMQACLEDIQAALKKYNCGLVFQQVYQNGLPAGPGMFNVTKNPDKPSGIIHPEANA